MDESGWPVVGLSDAEQAIAAAVLAEQKQVWDIIEHEKTNAINWPEDYAAFARIQEILFPGGMPRP